ncbi:hypothetical protein GCM10011390_40470 [Aureimonas endophytica]|uniref:Uncharacterized protein n=1 Tax=Aureimonas endophytica TaxID=2027858 RepID=A0A917E9H6_9HYPH|nr:hypothetical protein [Aureimonas endophytica]GGE17278.1 hypothetical protein GCM10011390_40470 [Aureimonas endophytica]
MSHKALAEGAAAFARGEARTANPHDADSEDWLCWRDGFEQARAFAERGTARPEGAVDAPPASPAA